jgi:hypothetical protein
LAAVDWAPPLAGVLLGKPSLDSLYGLHGMSPAACRIEPVFLLHCGTFAADFCTESLGAADSAICRGGHRA